MSNDKNVPQDAIDEVYLEPETTSLDANSLYDDIFDAGQLTDHTINVTRIDSESLLRGLPTQVVHPWRTVARTAIQHVSSIIVTGVIWLLLGLGVDVSNLETELVISVALILTTIFSGLFARIMASNGVENFLVKWLTPLATGVSEEDK